MLLFLALFCCAIVGLIVICHPRLDRHTSSPARPSYVIVGQTIIRHPRLDRGSLVNNCLCYLLLGEMRGQAGHDKEAAPSTICGPGVEGPSPRVGPSTLRRHIVEGPAR